MDSVKARFALSDVLRRISQKACVERSYWGRLNGKDGRQTAVVLEPATSAEMSSMVLDAHGLTPAQERVAGLVLRGHSTKEIVDQLQISANTVQEHLGAVFEKFGVRSRRELVALLLGRPH
jgi:DNA-binding CsgD family transcriptional regulator